MSISSYRVECESPLEVLRRGEASRRWRACGRIRAAATLDLTTQHPAFSQPSCANNRSIAGAPSKASLQVAVGATIPNTGIRRCCKLQPHHAIAAAEQHHSDNSAAAPPWVRDSTYQSNNETTSRQRDKQLCRQRRSNPRSISPPTRATGAWLQRTPSSSV